MKTLILTEKPSVARDFAKALNINGKIWENASYVITAAVGHLVELCNPEDYDAKWKYWNLNALPILPQIFKYKPIPRTQRQLDIISDQLNRNDIDRVIIATDAGREGEVIARTILEYGNNQKPTFRFWTSQALTPEVIQQTLKDIQPAQNYQRLFNAGQGRQFADWLIGMNLTRAATKKMGDLFSIGRVQTAVLSLLVDRRKEIDLFKPEPYWQPKAQFTNEKGTWWGNWFKGTLNRLATAEKAEAIADKIRNKTGIVTAVKKQKKEQKPPPLYSLTELQRDANKRFGFSAQNTLDLAQSLYEKRKCLSYPRSDSTVLGSKNVDMAKKIAHDLCGNYPKIFAGFNPKLIRLSNKRVFNDAKLTDHHALIPLNPVPNAATQDEKKVYGLVLKRFAAAFYPDCEFETTEIITQVNGESFKTKGKIILEAGWQVLYTNTDAKKDKPNDDDVILPPLEKNDVANTKEIKIEQKVTTPPGEYSESSLLGAMANPAKYVTLKELKSIFHGNVGLGTQATRAAIIEKLIVRKYINRNKKLILATEKGIKLIDYIRQLKVSTILASAEETARWEQRLEDIAKGKDDLDSFLNTTKHFVSQSVNEFKSCAQKIDLGSCPQCGATVIEGKKAFGCSAWKTGCTYVISRAQFFQKQFTEKTFVSN